jgi:SAM-dependent methyltransferase
MANQLKELYGDIDIYLFDQLLKGRFEGCGRIIDIGCGGGRNLHYFLKNGFEVFGIDRNQGAIDDVRALSQQLAPGYPTENFVVAGAEAIPFEDESFGLAISSAVLHFAENKNHFEQMLHTAWKMVKPGGYFFARLASDIGIENLVISLGNGRHMLPDGSERYLVTHNQLIGYTQSLNAELVEPLKTTNVHNMRAMTTWCLQKKLGA